MINKLFKRKINRLDLSNYQGSHNYYITICTDNKNSYFIKTNLVGHIIRYLHRLSKQEGFKVVVYTFMPDHLHFLLSFSSGNDLIKIIKSFKQVTGYNFKQKTGKQLWQKSFYDHVIRKDEDLKKIVEYIINNPVRAGLVKDWRDYRFTGSFEFDIKDASFID